MTLKLVTALALVGLSIIISSSVDAFLECKETKMGTEYKGKISKTLNGRTCQSWASQTPHEHDQGEHAANFPEGNLKDAANYCRNPDNSSDGPWCYTTDKNVLWEYCDVKFCDVMECKKSKMGTEYRGVTSRTNRGRACQRWESQTPHKHDRWTSYPEGNEKDAMNYCRNPNNSPEGPWCYTTDPRVPWEYCDVKLCVMKTCPVGFFYVEHVGRCYKLITDKLTWSDSNARCINQSPTAHLAAITNALEHVALLYHLQTLNYTIPEFGNCKNGRGIYKSIYIFYTSGQRINLNDCKSKFVWKLRDQKTKELTYNVWPVGGGPSCSFGMEACMAYDTGEDSLDYRMNDLACNGAYCSICEADPTA